MPGGEIASRGCVLSHSNLALGRAYHNFSIYPQNTSAVYTLEIDWRIITQINARYVKNIINAELIKDNFTNSRYLCANQSWVGTPPWKLLGGIEKVCANPA